MDSTTERKTKKKNGYIRASHYMKMTPWKDEWEWRIVSYGIADALSLLQNGRMVPSIEFDFSNLEEAINTCEIWKLRSAMLPHAIDCSYNISKLLREDCYTSTNTTNNIQTTLHLAYATVIIRSVNGLADQLQQNRAYAGSISHICQKLGLPTWVVDLRHESAHNELPSLPRLRLAAHTILAFFHERYWLVVGFYRENRRQHAQSLLQEYTLAAKREAGNEFSSRTSTNETEDETKARTEQIDENDFIALSTANADQRKKTELSDYIFEDEETMWLQDNFFAALHQPKKKMKKSKKQESDDTKIKEEISYTENRAMKSNQLSSLKISKSFIEEIKQDIAYFVAIDYLVWNDEYKILVTAEPQLYRTLLQQLCERWPGFASAFITHCIEYFLQRSNSKYIALWFKMMLFDLSPEMKILPLKSLLKRLYPMKADAEPLIKIISEALEQDAKNTNECDQTEEITTNWKLVENWEFCSIGSLPGFAV